MIPTLASNVATAYFTLKCSFQCLYGSSWYRQFSSTSFARKHKALPARPSVPEHEIEEVFIKGGGNGGQKINKTNSKVQLRHVPTGLVVSSQVSRSREQNRKAARLLLAEELQFRTDPANSRRTLKIEKLQKQKEQQRKKAMKRKKERDVAKDEHHDDQPEPAQDSHETFKAEPFDNFGSDMEQFLSQKLKLSKR
ncbi:RF-1 domain-containing protein [Lipomyces japonicus]|uniref:RF-1 domain-containing protein n=1 Tax=Lipomyces japonicus TaxID=56871 RepID=UPI0034CF5192